MKKKIVWLVTVILMLGLFAGCQKNSSKPEEGVKEEKEEEKEKDNGKVSALSLASGIEETVFGNSEYLEVKIQAEYYAKPLDGNGDTIHERISVEIEQDEDTEHRITKKESDYLDVTLSEEAERWAQSDENGLRSYMKMYEDVWYEYPRMEAIKNVDGIDQSFLSKIDFKALKEEGVVEKEDDEYIVTFRLNADETRDYGVLERIMNVMGGIQEIPSELKLYFDRKSQDLTRAEILLDKEDIYSDYYEDVTFKFQIQFSERSEIKTLMIPSEVMINALEQYDEEETWRCTYCYTAGNVGKYCTECGNEFEEDDELKLHVNTDGVIIDNNEFSFIITSLGENYFGEYELVAECESKNIRALDFEVEGAYVNGVYCSIGDFVEVAGNEKDELKLTFTEEQFETYGITEVDCITFLLQIKDAETREWLVEGAFAYYPNGVENAANYSYELSEDAMKVFEKDGLSMYITDIEEGDYGYYANVYLENNTDKYLEFDTGCFAINGLGLNSEWEFLLYPGMKAHERIFFGSEEMKKRNITLPISSVQFALEVIDYCDPYGEEYVKDDFRVYPMGENSVVHYEYAADDADIVLADKDACRVIVTDYKRTEESGFIVEVMVENKADKNLFCSMKCEKLNDTECRTFGSVYAPVGCIIYEKFTWTEDKLLKEGITDVDSVTFEAQISEREGFATFVNDTFTFDLQ